MSLTNAEMLLVESLIISTKQEDLLWWIVKYPPYTYCAYGDNMKFTIQQINKNPSKYNSMDYDFHFKLESRSDIFSIDTVQSIKSQYGKILHQLYVEASK